jgi:hypothetical protein
MDRTLSTGTALWHRAVTVKFGKLPFRSANIIFAKATLEGLGQAATTRWFTPEILEQQNCYQQ